MGLSVTQLIGTLLDGSARHTPEGTEFTKKAIEDLGRTVTERDAPFGDYGQEKRKRG
jgi:enoyl-CoA hydratase